MNGGEHPKTRRKRERAHKGPRIEVLTPKSAAPKTGVTLYASAKQIEDARQEARAKKKSFAKVMASRGFVQAENGSWMVVS